VKTSTIARNEWQSFFDGFSRRHEGWLVTLEVFQPQIGAQVEARDLSLEGLSAELGKGHKGKIEIMIGGRPHQHITHTVFNPVEVSLEHTEYGANHALAIRSADKALTLLCLRPPMRPELAEAMISAIA
jgi:hypothetical protein